MKKFLRSALGNRPLPSARLAAMETFAPHAILDESRYESVIFHSYRQECQNRHNFNLHLIP